MIEQPEFSEIKVRTTVCIVPIHIWEDSLVESNLEYIKRGSKGVTYNIDLLEQINIQRQLSYVATVWYPEIEGKIPTAKGVLYRIESLKHLMELLRTHIPSPDGSNVFVRLCDMSPKDVLHPPIFSDATKAYEVLLSSNRTRYNILSKSLFLRELRVYNWEARCFWSRNKLRAVSFGASGLDQITKDKILKFFTTYGHFIPYNSVVVDIGEVNNGSEVIELIEFNTFGPDMLATAGHFCWHEDLHILLASPEPIFRDLPEYSF